MNATPPAPGLEELNRYLYENHGFDLMHYNPSFLQRRLQLRMAAQHVAGYGDYLALLRADRREYLDLINALSVNVTEFFRDAPLYQAVAARVLPKIMAANVESGRRSALAWSAGCASGQEAYTLAMILDDYFGRQAPAWPFTIHASDISEEFLAVAREGKYSKEKAAGVPAGLRRRYLSEDGGSVCVAPRLKKTVHFFRHDLAAAPVFGGVDLIFCRNVMIYFSTDTKEKMLRSFHGCLRREGFLVLGGSEIILKPDLFELADPEHKIYRRTGP